MSKQNEVFGTCDNPASSHLFHDDVKVHRERSTCINWKPIKTPDAAVQTPPAVASEGNQELRPEGGCDLPPRGWYCGREKGHAGPCAARPEESYDDVLATRCMEHRNVAPLNANASGAECPICYMESNPMYELCGTCKHKRGHHAKLYGGGNSCFQGCSCIDFKPSGAYWSPARPETSRETSPELPPLEVTESEELPERPGKHSQENCTGDTLRYYTFEYVYFDEFEEYASAVEKRILLAEAELSTLKGENLELKSLAPRWHEQGNGTTHWEECWQDHRNCALAYIARLKGEIEKRDREIAETRGKFSTR